MSVASTLTSGFVALATADEDSRTGRMALAWVIGAINTAAQIACVWFAPWYIGWLLAVLCAIVGVLLTLHLNAAISDESFERVGVAIGSGIARVRGLFSKQAAA